MTECGTCFRPFKDGERVYHWYEHYVCGECVASPDNPGLRNLSSHIWREVA